MTATANAYSAGFGIAAEGLEQWSEQPVPEELSGTDKAQKIYPITGNQFVLALTMRGDIVSRDRSFHFGLDLQNRAARLGANFHGDCYDFVEALSANAATTVEAAIKSGTLDGYMEVYCTFVGYFRGRPRCVYADFSPNTGRAKVTEVRLRPGWKDLRSSPKIVAAFERNDPRFAEFRKPFGPSSSLQEAADFAESFIRASCYLPATHQIDSENAGYFGGHIHVATLAPPDPSLKSRILEILRARAVGEIPVGPRERAAPVTKNGSICY